MTVSSRWSSTHPARTPPHAPWCTSAGANSSARWRSSTTARGSPRARRSEQKSGPAGRVNTEHKPGVGDHITLGGREFIVLEIVDLMPARGEFHFLHATLRPTPV